MALLGCGHRTPRHRRPRHGTVFSVAGRLVASRAVAWQSVAGEPNIPRISSTSSSGVSGNVEELRLVALGTGWATGRTPAVRLWRFLPRTGGRQSVRGVPFPPRIPQIQRDAGRALRPRVVPAVAARAIAERRERTSGQQRERKMALATSTVRSAGEGRGDGGAPANQLGAACSSRRRPGKGATC
jgi:hypothetical protein